MHVSLFRADSRTNLIKQGGRSKDDHWLYNSVVSRIARGPGFESRSGHDFFLPCYIWWLIVGSRKGQRATKSACFVVPPLFRADSRTNLIKQRENVKGRPLAQQLSCLTDSERPWVRVPAGPQFFFLPCYIWWLSVGSRKGQRASKSACFVVPPLFRADSRTNLIKQGENVKGRPLAQQLSCLTDSERPWVRVPVGPRFFPPL